MTDKQYELLKLAREALCNAQRLFASPPQVEYGELGKMVEEVEKMMGINS